ncbi:MAG: amidohydrolase [Deferribacteres bacterium]|nr:amidohydrolase [candidate division KSB1 bacterium]MCB9501845.1 amidohydrolase [Deferribacteres bacterium]
MPLDLKIALIQTSLHWQNAAENRKMFEDFFSRVDAGTDLVVLPEMFTTGFTMKARDCAETMQDETVPWLLENALNLQSHICGSVIIEENGAYFNRLLWATPEGDLHTYDKRHLFRMAREHLTYTAGSKRLIVDVAGWKICPFVCYDLRFPVWIRNKLQEYDLALFVANWPAKRSRYWRMLLPARAVENQAYVVGVNRVGVDGLGYPYSGDSAVISPVGDTIAEYTENSGVYTHTLSWELLHNCRRDFPVWQDADDFEIKVDRNDN